MTAAPEFSQGTAWQRRRPVVVAGAAILAVAAVVAVVVGSWPILVLAGLAAVVVLGFIVSRLELAVALLAAGFFFNAYLTATRGSGILTVDKGIGALAVVAWALDWVVNRRAIVTSRGLWVICAFLLWLGVSLIGAESYKAALVTSLRYVTFAILYFLVLQTVRGNRHKADVLIRVLTLAATVASIIGLAAFFSHHVTRASGPIMDPNDFGFILGSSVPLVIYQVRWAATWWGKAICAMALVVILACTFATFSRSAIAGLVVASLWAIATRRIRVRWLIAAIVTLLVVVGAVWLEAPKVLQTAFGQKAHVATANVDIRFGYYRVEISEWEHYPITGVGPGQFDYRFYQFAPGAGESLPFPSNVLTISGEEAYLVILAEQGVVGLVLFLGYLVVSWRDLRRRFPADNQADNLQSALAAGFVVACIGAVFLAEQYYPPLWFLPALGASMAGGMARFPARASGSEASAELSAATADVGSYQ